MPATASARSVRFLIAGAAVAVAAVVGAVLVPLSAQAAPLSLSGTVSGPTGTALKGVTVTALEFESSPTPDSVATTVTASGGAFTFPTLEVGTYTLSFSASASTYAQYLGNTTDVSLAQNLTLTTGAGAHSFIAASLSGSGTISGTVRTSSGKALKNYTVESFHDDNGSLDRSLALSTKTSSSGAYSLTGLVPGSYQVEALDTTSGSPLYAPQFGGGATTLDTSGVYDVSATASQHVNFSLGKSGSISGKVTGLTGMTVHNLSGVRVTPYALGANDDSDSAYSIGARSVVTKTDGSYTVTGLAPGYYTLEFATPTTSTGTVYGRTFLGTSDNVKDSDTVLIGSGTAIKNENIQLTASATIGGTVVDFAHQTGPGLPNVRVTLDYEGFSADNAASDDAPTTLTDSSGNFSFPGLGAGQYTFTVGNSTDLTTLSGEDTTWQRESVDVGNAVIANENYSQRIAVTKKDALGLHATTRPGITVATTLAVGNNLTASPGTWNATIDSEPLYKWYRSGHQISGAFSSTYTLQPGDAGENISVSVTGYNFAYGSATASSFATGPVALGSNFLSSNDATVLGDPHVGKTVTANAGDWSTGAYLESPLLTFQWQSSTDNSTWSDLPGETGTSFLLSPAAFDAGPYLRARVTGTLEGYNTAQTATPSVTILAGVFTQVKAPKLTTTSSTYSMSAGTWSPSIGSSNYNWYVHNSDGSLLSHTFGPTLSRTGLANKFVSVEVVREADGYANANGSMIVVQTGDAPVPSGTETITTTAAKVGVEMDAPLPTWSKPLTALSFKWQRETGSSWANISGAALYYYVPVAADQGHALRVVLTATATGYPNGVLTTAPTSAVALGDAAQYTPPSSLEFNGAVETNTTLFLVGGSWDNDPTLTYQWQTSTDGGTTFQPIAGATAEFLLIPPATVGKELYVQITAKQAGHATASVERGGTTIAKGTFKNLTKPKVTTNGSNFVVSTGTWSPVPDSYSYRWAISLPNGSNTLVSTTTPTLPKATVGTQHAVVEVFPAGSLTTSGNSGPILVQLGALAPTGSLTIGGDGALGSMFTAPNPSTWTNLNTPSQVTYQWQYQSGSKWKSIAGATAASFYPFSTYFDKNVRVALTASATGYVTTTAYSLPTLVLPATGSPSVGSASNAPAFGGTPLVGNTVTIAHGNWSAENITFGYQWGTKVASTFTPIPGATKASYTIPAAELGATLGVKITAAAVGFPNGEDTVYETNVVGAGTLTNLKLPKVTASSGGKLTAAPGTWNVTGTTPSYFWEVVDTATGNTLAHQTSLVNSYTPPTADAGDFVRLTVTVSHAAYSNGSAVVVARAGKALVPTSALTVSGTLHAGDPAAANAGSWVASPSIAYQWYRGSSKISGAGSQVYVLQSADVGKVISVAETVSKFGYVTAIYKVPYGTGLAAAMLSATTSPVISGTPKVDSTVTASPGVWNTPSLKFRYQWFRNSYLIAGATSKSYTLAAADEGAQLEVVVTASRTNYTTEESLSSPVTVDAGVALSLSKLTLPSTGALGSVLKPTLGSWNYPVTATYDWQYEPAGGSAWVDIDGASSNTYTPTVADGVEAGGKIQLIIIATRPGHPTSAVTSTAVTLH